MKYLITLRNKNYEVEVEKGEAILVSVSDAASTPVAAPVAAPAAASAPVASGAPVSGSGRRVDAPLPGMVVDIKVTVGTAVKKGDVVVIIEAMKMESNIVSPCDGVVSSIACTKGAEVGMNELLLTLAEG